MPRKGLNDIIDGGTRRVGFNEAEAVMPRKGARGWPVALAIRNFNEAEAVMPRKGKRKARRRTANAAALQ